MVPNPVLFTGRVIGGSSVLNTMLYVRGNRRDYDQWAAMGNEGWSYDEILPYFKKSEDQRNPYLAKDTRYHSTGGYLTVQDSPYNTPLGVAFVQAGEEMGYVARHVATQSGVFYSTLNFRLVIQVHLKRDVLEQGQLSSMTLPA